MFNIGMPEMILIFGLAIVIFGPKQLPEMGKAVGNALKEFRSAAEGIGDSKIQEESKEENIKK